jgi:hypothetical protein
MHPVFTKKQTIKTGAGVWILYLFYLLLMTYIHYIFVCFNLMIILSPPRNKGIYG